MKRISIIGAGTMAQGMARNFIEKDIEVYLWNRTPEKLRQLELQGAKICKSPKEAAEKSRCRYRMCK